MTRAKRSLRCSSELRLLQSVYPNVLPLRIFVDRWLKVSPSSTESAVSYSTIVGTSQTPSPDAPGLPLGDPLNAGDYDTFLDKHYIACDLLPRPQWVSPGTLGTSRTQSDIVTDCISFILHQPSSTRSSLDPTVSRVRNSRGGPRPGSMGLGLGGSSGTSPSPLPPPLRRTGSEPNLGRYVSQGSSTTTWRPRPPPVNVLVAGYRLVQVGSKTSLKGQPAIESCFPNTLVNTVKSRPWQKLLGEIGEPSMVYLLTKTSVFQRLPNNCFCQITGFALDKRVQDQDRQGDSTASPSPGVSRISSADSLSILGSVDQPLTSSTAATHSDTPTTDASPPRKRRKIQTIPPTEASPIPTQRAPLASCLFNRPAILFNKATPMISGLPRLGLPLNHCFQWCTQTKTPAHPAVNQITSAIFGTRFFTNPDIPPATSNGIHTPQSVPAGMAGADSAKKSGPAPIRRTTSLTLDGVALLTKVKTVTDPTHHPRIDAILRETRGSRMAQRRRKIRQKAKIARRKLADHWPRYQHQTPTPQRLSTLRPWVRKVLQNHKKCPYRALFSRWCPLPPRDRCPSSPELKPRLKPKPAEPTYTEADSQDSTFSLIDLLIEYDSDATDIVESPTPPTQEPIQAPQPPANTNYLSLGCSHHQVTFFVQTVLIRLIPPSLWGSRANRTIVFKFIRRFISAPRFDNFTLADLLRHFKTADCQWLDSTPSEPSASKTSHHRCYTDRRRRDELIWSFMWWLIEGLVIPLIRGFFYVTDSAETRKRLLYYRHDVWSKYTHTGLAHLVDTMYQRIPADQAPAYLARSKLACSRVRLMPKSNGLRLISQLSRPPAIWCTPPSATSALDPVPNTATRSKTNVWDGGHPGRSVNNQLRDPFAVLHAEKQRQPDQFAGSVFGLQDIYTRLSAYRRSIRSLPLPPVTQFYLVKLDIQRAYDHIPQAKLLKIVRRLIHHEEYLIHRHKKMAQGRERIKTRHLREGLPLDEFPQFPVFAADRAQVPNIRPGTVFVDEVSHMISTRHEILGLIEDHLQRNTVQINDELYHQTQGIPQGSLLSTLLCNLFLGDLEKRLLTPRRGPHSLLLRLADDFLFITPDRAEAIDFYKFMHHGLAESGCRINPSKTLTNFTIHPDHAPAVKLGSPSKSIWKQQPPILAEEPALKSTTTLWKSPTGGLQFPWCGLLIDTNTLEIRCDYRRYKHICLRDTLMIPHRQRMGQFIRSKLAHMLLSKLVPIYLSLEGRRPAGVLTNVVENFLHNALRLCVLLGCMPVPPTARYVYTCVEHCVDETARFICDFHRRMGQDHQLCTLSHMVWLGYRAFLWVFQKRQTKYRAVLTMLRRALNQQEVPPDQLVQLRAAFRDCDWIAFQQMKI